MKSLVDNFPFPTFYKCFKQFIEINPIEIICFHTNNQPTNHHCKHCNIKLRKIKTCKPNSDVIETDSAKIIHKTTQPKLQNTMRMEP